MNGQITYLNAGSGNEYAATEPAPADAANTIDKVRELLYGDAMRSQERRHDDLREDGAEHLQHHGVDIGQGMKQGALWWRV